ncbi:MULTISPECIES: J domain-containing protein [Legionella]|uniref:Chaperone protein DnaJ n=1 Tax=Legionella drozanskii LLAP-1 TaxID=1212489 RepID=A0A0W0SLU8_9GAMM|nr:MULTISPECIES: J domain-containing protein [Legionella]KTC84378.1 Chaperone protein DnaJ [Legionella drozanskii LLAP-1]PJE06871.1 MAG: J domain-containing protein [Legionella sp.]
MNQYDALKVLGLSGEVTADQIKAAYKKACSKYHPDRNPAGLEIMKMINVAYEVLKSYDGKSTVTVEAAQYGDEMAEALNSISGLGLSIEICGAWVWVSGNTKDHKDALKSAGFKWTAKKLCWYFKPSDAVRCRSFGQYSMETIRAKYGSVSVMEGRQKKLE